MDECLPLKKIETKRHQKPPETLNFIVKKQLYSSYIQKKIPKICFGKFANWTVDGAQIDFMKTGHTSKISQISEFQNHLPKKYNFYISISPS